MTAVSKRGICMHTLPFGRRPEAGSETAGVKIKSQPIAGCLFYLRYRRLRSYQLLQPADRLCDFRIPRRIVFQRSRQILFVGVEVDHAVA